MLYSPAAVLAGVVVGGLQAWRLRASPLGLVLAAMLVFLGGGWGTWQRVRAVDPSHLMLAEADLKAMTWIRENTSPKAQFLVNGFTAYGGGLVVGADGGWWIPLLAVRANTVPPLLYGSELAKDPGYQREVRDVLVGLLETGVTSESGLRILSEHGLTHVYIGQRNGATGSPGAPLLQLDELLYSTHMEELYAQDGVWVFAFDEG